MRHRSAKKKLGRTTSHRRAMMRNMVTSLFKYEQLETTDAKAKQLRKEVAKMMTLAKRGDLHARRQALSFMKDKAVTHRLFGELKDRFLDRQGGYVRIIKKGTRKGDGAPVSIIQLLPVDGDGKKGKKKSKVSTPKKETKDKKKVTPKKEVAAKKSEKVEEKGELPVEEPGKEETQGESTEEKDN